MSRTKKIQALIGIAAMLKDRDMAALAALTAHRNELQAQIETLRNESRAALEAGLASVEAATAAEKHALWAVRRRMAVGQQVDAVQVEIDAQIARTTQSVGRHGNLSKLAGK